MKKELKHLKKFESEMINEEVSMEQIAMIMQAITATGQVASPHTISLQQAMQQSTILTIEFGVARTSDHEVYYNLSNPNHNKKDIQENLPTSPEAGAPTHYIEIYQKDIENAIKSGSEVFGKAKYISEAEAKKAGAEKKVNKLGTDITDFISIDGEVVNESGKITLTLGDGKNKKIIASGNGLYLLVRTAANNQSHLDSGAKNFIKLNVLEMKSAVVDSQGNFKDTDYVSIKTSADKTLKFENIHVAFQLGTEHYENIIKKGEIPGGRNLFLFKGLFGEGSPVIRNGVHVDNLTNMNDIIIGGSGLREATNLGEARDQNIIDIVDGQLYSLYDFLLIPGDLSSSIKDMDIKVKKMNKDEIKSYLNKFKSAKTEEERQGVMKEFVEKAMGDYKESFLNFVDGITKKTGVSKEQILQEFKIDEKVQDFVDNFKPKKSAVQGTGSIPLKKSPQKKPIKKIESSETQVKVGETKYQIRTKTAEVETKTDLSDPNLRRGIPTIKKESLKYLRTFENFRQNKKRGF
jgi:hypothetical protein